MPYFSTAKACERVQGVKAHACPLCTQEAKIGDNQPGHPELHTGKNETEANLNVGSLLNEVLIRTDAVCSHLQTLKATVLASQVGLGSSGSLYGVHSRGCGGLVK